MTTQPIFQENSLKGRIWRALENHECQYADENVILHLFKEEEHALIFEEYPKYIAWCLEEGRI